MVNVWKRWMSLTSCNHMIRKKIHPFMILLIFDLNYSRSTNRHTNGQTERVIHVLRQWCLFWQTTQGWSSVLDHTETLSAWSHFKTSPRLGMRRIQAKQCDEPSDKNSSVYFSCLIIGRACSTGAAPSVSRENNNPHIFTRMWMWLTLI